MPALSHQQRIRAFQEETERKALARARAIFDLVSLLAIVRPMVTDPQLRQRISLALLNCHLCFEGEVKPDLPNDVIPIVKRA